MAVPSDDYTYDRQNMIEAVEDLAAVRLAGSFTLEVTAWEDGDFQAEAYHTIDATYPFDAEERGEANGLPFYRERIAFSTTGDAEGWLRHEVVRHRCGETAHNVIHSERFAGYTPNWPAPLEDDDGESNTPRVPYQGRFA